MSRPHFALRILHLAHAGLPDERIERSAWSSWCAGQEAHFAGPKWLGLSLPSDPFATKSELPFDLRSNLGEPISTNRLTRRFQQVVSRVRPDMIHAHDLFAGRLAARLDVPFVYDDHEYWSKEVVADSGPVDLVSTYKRILWSSWEDVILERANAVITVSEAIAQEHRRKNRRVLVVPNFPRSVEVSDLAMPTPPDHELVSVYVGNCTPPFVRFRDTVGLTSVFQEGKIGSLKVIGDRKLKNDPPVFSLGRMSHGSMMQEICKCQIGLIPWRKHWFHRYCNPNKAYEYAHAGCLVIVTASLDQVRRTLSDHCIAIDDYEEMSSVISQLARDREELAKRRRRIQEFARASLVWDRFDGAINEAYR